MAKVAVDTLTEKCYEECGQMDIASRPDGTLGCSKKFICKEGAYAFYNAVLERFEQEQSKANLKYAGMKEPAEWAKAIRIMEEYIE